MRYGNCGIYKVTETIVAESDLTGNYLHIKVSSLAFNRHSHLHRAFVLQRCG